MSDLDMGERENRRSDVPMDVAIEMTTLVTHTSAGLTIFGPMYRNENKARRRRR